ncbi:MAG: formylglycine-generating enzyme family protein [Prevotellaceae bacterium]|jgi:formylglycine-generating enzyme required for sulfatase activity|nr:formylglycine-generating enzyme family protein [Prevotellaceae bacterium]
MKKVMLLAAVAGVMLFCGGSSSDDEGKDDNNNKRKNGEVYTSDGIEMVYVEGSDTVKGFYIGKYEVTQKQYQDVMDTNPSGFKGDNRPVERVNWDDVQEFIKKLNARTGRSYRLPTATEGEYAAREGTKKSNYEYSGSKDINEVAWYEENSNGETHPVGEKKPNALGIYDMTGNVHEWCQDCWDSSCSYRWHRGGSWDDRAERCRVAFRHADTPDDRDYHLGFRLALP